MILIEINKENTSEKRKSNLEAYYQNLRKKNRKGGKKHV